MYGDPGNGIIGGTGNGNGRCGIMNPGGMNIAGCGIMGGNAGMNGIC